MLCDAMRCDAMLCHGAQAMLFFSRSDDPIDYSIQLDSLGLKVRKA
jgi:hypothetical protein